MGEDKLVAGVRFMPNSDPPIWPMGVNRVPSTDKLSTDDEAVYEVRLYDGSTVTIRPGWSVVYDGRGRRVGVTDREGMSLVLDEAASPTPLFLT